MRLSVHRAAAAAALALALALAGCRPVVDANGRDPFASLASPALSEIWDLPYWVSQSAAHSRLWQRSFAWCRARSATTPNCRTVRLASWWTAPPPVVVAVAPKPAAAPAPAASVAAAASVARREVQ